MAPIIDDPSIRTRRADAPAFYQAYLNSSEWRTRRNRALRLANYRCQRCGSKRDPNVHHKTYERLGAELDTDLEVLCFTCHNGHHLQEAAADPSKVYVKLVSEVVQRMPFALIADIADETKRLCLKHKVPINVPLIDKAIALVCATRLKDGKREYRSVVDVDGRFEEPLTHAQTVELLARLRAAIGSKPPIKTMPKVRIVTQHQADKIRAFEMVTREIMASIERCEALEAEGQETA